MVVERQLELEPCRPGVVARRAGGDGSAAVRFYGDPTAELRVVGITGTNGKTTTAFLVRQILERAGVQCGLLGTVKQVVGGVEEEVERTTPGGDRPAGGPSGGWPTPATGPARWRSPRTR